MEELIVNNSRINLTWEQQNQQQPQLCLPTCVWPLSNCTGNALYSKVKVLT